MLALIAAVILTLTPLPADKISFLSGNFDFDRVSAEPISLGPKLTAQSAVVVNLEDGQVIFQKNPERPLPIASLTKLMTGLVFLERKNKGWEEMIEIKEEDLIREGEREQLALSEEKEELPPAQLGLKVGDRVKLKDIFSTALIGSANDSARVLTRCAGSEGENFVKLMNDKAKQLGMNQTFFQEPTGLSPESYSTSQDLIKLLTAVLEREEMKQVLTRPDYSFSLSRQGGNYWYRVMNRNKLIDNFIGLDLAKTGYLEESGYCFAGRVEEGDKKLAVVVLGADNNQDRFQEAKALIWWAEEQLNNQD